MLMVQRAQQPSKGKLDFPGGFVDYNGSNEQALITELLEELQLPIDNMEYFFLTRIVTFGWMCRVSILMSLPFSIRAKYLGVYLRGIIMIGEEV
jgi:ADP-ribose pyrophosphatase YjhB (NUDIX family)